MTVIKIMVVMIRIIIIIANNNIIIATANSNNKNSKDTKYIKESDDASRQLSPSLSRPPPRQGDGERELLPRRPLLRP